MEQGNGIGKRERGEPGKTLKNNKNMEIWSGRNTKSQQGNKDPREREKNDEKR